MGQVNSILLLLYVYIFYTYLEDRPKKLGGLLALSLFIKPFALIFLPYLAIKRKFSALYYSLIVALFLAITPLLFYPSWAQFFDLYTAWFNELTVVMSSKQQLFALRNHCIFLFIARMTSLNNILVSPINQQYYRLTLLSVMGLGFLYYLKKGSYLVDAANGEFALLRA